MCPVWTGPNNCTFGLSFFHKNRHFYTLICRCFLQLFTWLQKAKVFASCVSFVTCSMLLFCSKVTAMQQGTERSRPCPSLIYELTSLTAYSAPAASQRICRTEKHISVCFSPLSKLRSLTKSLCLSDVSLLKELFKNIMANVSEEDVI